MLIMFSVLFNLIHIISIYYTSKITASISSSLSNTKLHLSGISIILSNYIWIFNRIVALIRTRSKDLLLHNTNKAIRYISFKQFQNAIRKSCLLYYEGALWTQPRSSHVFAFRKTIQQFSSLCPNIPPYWRIA